MINLGDRVKDTVTGYQGIVVAKTQWLNGCNRLTVQSETLKDGVPAEPFTFDEPQLKLVETEVVEPGPRITGGPIPTPKQNKGPVR